MWISSKESLTESLNKELNLKNMNEEKIYNSIDEVKIII